MSRSSVNRTENARQLQHQVLSLLNRPKKSHAFVLTDTACALDKLTQAAVLSPELETLGAEIASATVTALYELAPLLTEILEGSVSAEDVYFSLGNASGLITAGRDEFYRDRLNYTCMLAARIRLVFHERDLAERGFPLAKAIEPKRLMQAPRLPSETLN